MNSSPDMGLGLGMAVIAVLVLVGIAVGLGVLYLVYLAMEGVPEKHRPMQPGMVFLLLIPFFSLYWAFRVFPPMMEGYKAALEAKGVNVAGDGGRGLALAYCIAVCVCIIPFVNLLAGPAALILFIITLVKAFEQKKLAA